jgi:hypothetical protein
MGNLGPGGARVRRDPGSMVTLQMGGRAGSAVIRGPLCIWLELESFYSITTFIRAITSLLQIRQVAHLMEHHMQLARIKPHA